ncbi:Phage integrase family protein [Butyrivibrio sp. ob235]|nr:Phage integrase family protein [Butyrivibrio sp. ob235]
MKNSSFMGINNMSEGINYTDRTAKLLEDMPDYVVSFINRYSGRGKAATMFEYSRDIFVFFEYLINFHPEFCDKKMIDITTDDLGKLLPEDIDNFIATLRNTKDKRFKRTDDAYEKSMRPKKNSLTGPKKKNDETSEATLKRKKATISAFYSYLLSNGKVTMNPVLASRKIDIPKKKLIYLDFEEQNKLLDTVINGTGLGDNTRKYHSIYAERDAAMFILLLDTGLRVSEMLNTNIVDFDLNKGKVTVIRKGGDQQDTYYSDECAAYLWDYFESQKARFPYTSEVELPAFTTTKGERLSVRAVETLVKKYVKAALPNKAHLISPHKLRSSFAMSLYEASNYNLLLVQKRLNHASVTTTTVYAKAVEKEVESSRNTLQEYKLQLEGKS